MSDSQVQAAIKKKKLIINADDYGLSAPVSEGIIKGWSEGIISSSSAIMNMPDAVKWLKKAPKDMPIGLHLNVTLGKPVLPPELVPTLVNSSGNFYPLIDLLKRFREVSLDELRAEAQAQAARFLSSGRSFDHIDYHQHVFVIYNPFFPIVIELAQQYDVAIRQPIPIKVKVPNKKTSTDYVWDYVQLGLQNPVLMMQTLPKMMLWERERVKDIKQYSLRTPRYLLLDLFRNYSYEKFEAIVKQLPAGITEMVVHPALNSSADGAGDYTERYGLEERSSELDLLCDDRARAFLISQSIELTNFSSIKKS